LNSIAVQVRDTAACSVAAAAEDARATAVLAESVKPKIHAAVFLITCSCSGKVVERCFTQALTDAGARSVETRSGKDASLCGVQHSPSSGRFGVIVSRFLCCCKAHTHRCGNDILHRMHSTLMHCTLHAPELMRLVYSAMIPHGYKYSIAQLVDMDTTSLLPLNIPREVWTWDSDTSFDLSALITVVVTTSPMRSDPDLDILKSTFGSLALAGLQNCRMILVCDQLEIDPTPEFGTEFVEKSVPSTCTI
jgi:hypothetical protein